MVFLLAAEPACADQPVDVAFEPSVAVARPHPSCRRRHAAFRSSLTSNGVVHEGTDCEKAVRPPRSGTRSALLRGGYGPGGPQSTPTRGRPSARGRAASTSPRRTSPHEAPHCSACTGCGRRPRGVHAVRFRQQSGRAREPVADQPGPAWKPEHGEPERPRVAVAVGLLAAAATPQHRRRDTVPAVFSCQALVTVRHDFVMVSRHSPTG